MLAESTRIGDFQIRGLIGEGAMGQVYLAHDVRLGRRVALKLIKRAVIQSHGAVRFLEEARATASFNHPHIVTLYAVGEYEGRPYLALEYIDGKSLRAHLAAGPLPLREALRYCHAVADAISEAHRRGLVHADLKPENIVISSDGRVRVVDFGLAKIALDAPSAASGTPAYMAPERWRGAPPTGAIDVWALGVTLCELVTGSRPIPDATLAHVAFGTDTLDLSGLLPAASWSQLVRECLALDPRARPTAEELVRRFSRLVASEAAISGDGARATGVLAPHAQYLTTQPAVRHTYLSNRRLSFLARDAGSLSDAWVAPVVEQMVRRIFRDREDRRFEVDRVDDATSIELAFVRNEDGFRIDARFQGEQRVLVSAMASSVAGAARKLADALHAKLGVDLEPLQPGTDELEAMRHIGATSVPLFRRYRNLVRTYLANMMPDAHRLAAAARELIDADPEWAHPYALLAFLEGLDTEACREVLAAAQRMANAGRDPVGIALLRVLELPCQEATYNLLNDALRGIDTDLLACWVRLMMTDGLHRTEESTAFVRRLYIQYPELMFGMHFANFFRWEGRDAEADRAIREWAEMVPENVVARVQLAEIEASAGRLEEARRRAHEAVAIHRDSDDALPDLFEALVGTDQISDARAIAERMLMGSPLSRARGRYRAAVISVYQGRFAAAYDAVLRAIAEHRAFRWQSELTQCLELARVLAPLVADHEAQCRHTKELADVFANMLNDTCEAAATRFELALLDHRETQPSITEHLTGLEESSVRDARRRMLRAAAAAECGSAHLAVAAGFSAFEANTASLVAFGLCAWRVRELELARQSLTRATRLWSSIRSNQSSPYHAILARFHLAGVLAELGEHAAARSAYEAFLRCWSDPDRPLPEVSIARRMLISVSA